MKKSMGELESEIEEFIVRTDKGIWGSWYEQVREGKVIIPDDEHIG